MIAVKEHEDYINECFQKITDDVLNLLDNKVRQVLLRDPNSQSLNVLYTFQKEEGQLAGQWVRKKLPTVIDQLQSAGYKVKHEVYFKRDPNSNYNTLVESIGFALFWGRAAVESTDEFEALIHQWRMEDFVK